MYSGWFLIYLVHLDSAPRCSIVWIIGSASKVGLSLIGEWKHASVSAYGLTSILIIHPRHESEIRIIENGQK